MGTKQECPLSSINLSYFILATAVDKTRKMYKNWDYRFNVNPTKGKQAI